ncbi:MAG: thioesterase [Desulfomicrobium apsheronum]|nr:thioesterase [Desulfomicrobium apsheronum]
MDTVGGMIFEQGRKIQLFHTDATGRVTLASLCRFAQESAGGHAERLGVGMERLAGKNMAWVLREQAMHVTRYPGLGEVLRITTWPTRAERILCHRDYRILDESGQLVARGTSAWLGLDLATRRPCKAESFFHLPAEAMLAPVFERPLPELQAPLDGCPSDIRTVRASDMDALGHMNNLRYLDWIMDHLGLFGMKTPFGRVRIRHAREVRDGDKVEVRHGLTEDGEVLLQMRRLDGGREVCLARLGLKPSEQIAQQ